MFQWGVRTQSVPTMWILYRPIFMLHVGMWSQRLYISCLETLRLVFHDSHLLRDWDGAFSGNQTCALCSAGQSVIEQGSLACAGPQLLHGTSSNGWKLLRLNLFANDDSDEERSKIPADVTGFDQFSGPSDESVTSSSSTQHTEQYQYNTGNDAYDDACDR